MGKGKKRKTRGGLRRDSGRTHNAIRRQGHPAHGALIATRPSEGEQRRNAQMGGEGPRGEEGVEEERKRERCLLKNPTEARAHFRLLRGQRPSSLRDSASGGRGARCAAGARGPGGRRPQRSRRKRGKEGERGRRNRFRFAVPSSSSFSLRSFFLQPALSLPPLAARPPLFPPLRASARAARAAPSKFICADVRREGGGGGQATVGANGFVLQQSSATAAEGREREGGRERRGQLPRLLRWEGACVRAREGDGRSGRRGGGGGDGQMIDQAASLEKEQTVPHCPFSLFRCASLPSSLPLQVERRPAAQ